MQKTEKRKRERLSSDHSAWTALGIKLDNVKFYADYFENHYYDLFKPEFKRQFNTMEYFFEELLDLFHIVQHEIYQEEMENREE